MESGSSACNASGSKDGSDAFQGVFGPTGGPTTSEAPRGARESSAARLEPARGTAPIERCARQDRTAARAPEEPLRSKGVPLGPRGSSRSARRSTSRGHGSPHCKEGVSGREYCLGSSARLQGLFGACGLRAAPNHKRRDPARRLMRTGR
jgi:hypothetical protein